MRLDFEANPCSCLSLFPTSPVFYCEEKLLFKQVYSAVFSLIRNDAFTYVYSYEAVWPKDPMKKDDYALHLMNIKYLDTSRPAGFCLENAFCYPYLRPDGQPYGMINWCDMTSEDSSKNGKYTVVI